MSDTDHFDTTHELEKLAVDETTTPERRAAARGALAEIAGCRAQERIVAAARVVSAQWDDDKYRADVLILWAEQATRGGDGVVQRRKDMILALDALRLQVNEANKAAKKAEQESSA